MSVCLKRIFVYGYPSLYGGAGTELHHQILVWRAMGLEVHLIPTWSPEGEMLAPDMMALGVHVHGDPLATLEVAREENIQIHLFSFYCHNSTWEIDKLSAQRLNHYMQKSYSVKAKEDEPFPHVHGKIIQLGKQKPDLVNQWLDEMFQLMAESPPQLRIPEGVFEVFE